MKGRSLRAMSAVILIATLGGASGCAVYEDGYYYREPRPVRPVYVYPRAYYYGAVHRDDDRWRHGHGWHRDD